MRFIDLAANTFMFDRKRRIRIRRFWKETSIRSIRPSLPRCVAGNERLESMKQP